jgi:hypothetical protein
MFHRSGIGLIVCGALVLGTAARAAAQLLAGPWIQESQKQIDSARKTDLRVIVLGADGRPVPGAEVLIEQTRRAFHVGLVLPETGWPKQGLGGDTHTEFWRCFNAVSLERMTDWPMLQPQAGSDLDAGQVELIERALDQAEARGMLVRWGSMVSADPGRVPGWAAELKGDALAKAVLGYTELIYDRFGGRVGQFDVYTQTLAHSFIEQGAGVSVVRRMYESVPAKSPGARTCARFGDALELGRFQKIQRRLTSMNEAFIPVDVVALDQRFGGTQERRSLVRLLSRIDQIPGPVVISSLTVGGDSGVSAAINLETVLRTMMERPRIEGIWFAGLTPESAGDPSGALLDEMGLPTPSGRVVDSLYYGQWRADIQTPTDGLGNVRVRVFPGAYRITAMLSDGSVCATDVYVKKSGDPQVVVLEPLRPGVLMETAVQ